MCSAPAERDVHFVRDVSFGSDVRFAREDAEHITSLCASAQYITVRQHYIIATKSQHHSLKTAQSVL